MKINKIAFAITTVASAFSALMLAGHGHAEQDHSRHHATQADDLKWSQPAAYGKGAELAIVSGDPTKEGFYVVRLRVPAGFRIAPHTHPNDENVTVLSGTFHVGTGETFDARKGATVKVGGFAHVGKGMTHYAYFPEATIIQLHGMGPQGITYVNPADDPRKK
jgi:quercetin dioxygenase-like cupin family protein